MTFAMTPLVWEYGAQSAEVFALNNLLCALVVYVTCCTFEAVAKEEAATHVYKLVYLGAFISGLMFANQHASTLFLAVLVPAVLYVVYPSALREQKLPTLLLPGGSIWSFSSIPSSAAHMPLT